MVDLVPNVWIIGSGTTGEVQIQTAGGRCPHGGELLFVVQLVCRSGCLPTIFEFDGALSATRAVARASEIARGLGYSVNIVDKLPL